MYRNRGIGSNQPWRAVELPRDLLLFRINVPQLFPACIDFHMMLAR